MIPWLRFLRENSRHSHTRIAFADSKEWQMNEGRLVHKTGGFFSVEGMRTTAALDALNGCTQPIINQPEIGILGFVVHIEEGEALWLLQAKGEPGNTNSIQLAPTVQATFSNYMRRHGGAPTLYLDHFVGEGDYLSDSLQSEQGTRFLRKFNRNIMVQASDRLPIESDAFGWCSSQDLSEVLLADYAINTDARSVITTGPWSVVGAGRDMFRSNKARSLFGEALAVSYDQKCRDGLATDLQVLVESIRHEVSLVVHACPLDALEGWIMTEKHISCAHQHRELVVEHFEVFAPGRERSQWDQPLFRSTGVDEVILFCQKRDGLLKFLLRPTLEPGLTGGVEIGPSFKRESAKHLPTWLQDLAANPSGGASIEVAQSDEGGRFMESRCRYRVEELATGKAVPEDPWNVWVSLSELELLCRTPKLLTNEARSVVSILLGLA
ncbi:MULTISPECIES: NDP-hexose 2,3-dehydratase family protein [Kordiimonas]|jgi:oxidase EvaA|uniref:NDP-hexose 2,3-dehydratase family protein n=1 Tax=Kordiimonas TaxID=288021 RepID=UPI002580FC31|nr:NDP-hexose 2,3-dehydratase family protein [Kordiimonas sp. UBA4487]